MKLTKKHTGWNNYLFFTLAVLFYIAFVIAFVVYMKSLAGEYILSDIDRRLFIAAKSIPFILADDYHDRAIKPGAIPWDEWEKTENGLTELASASGVRYAWTDVLIEDKIYLTSCNRTEQTDKEGLEIYYFMQYSQGVSQAEMSAFHGMHPVFTNFRDKWGNFRAVFIPFLSPGGKKYLACAEYTTGYVDEILSKSKRVLLLVALAFLLASLPVFLVYIRNLKSESKKLEESELNMRITLNSIGDGVIVTDNNSIVTMINPEGCIITGYSSEDALGRNLAEIFPVKKNIYPGTNSSDEESETGNFADLNGSFILESKDGTEKIITHNRSAIQSGDGIIKGSVIVVKDISDRIRLEDELRQSQKMESIGRLAGGIAHDFNNMLAAIKGSAELLRLYGSDDRDIKENSNIILRASEKASGMINKLLAFSRKEEFREEIIDIHECIANTISMLQSIIDRRIEIRVSIEAEDHYIKGDFNQIENALLNLGINARDAMEDGGILEIATRDVTIDNRWEIPPNVKINPGQFIEITISDTGYGIPKKNQKKIFEPFFTTKKKGKGTGLGLFMVYGAIQMHNGLIYLTSETGKGSKFSLYFPVTDKRIDDAGGGTSLHKNKGHILFVDDEKLILMSGANILKSMGYEVITASDGIEALELYQNNMDKISLAIIDLTMPRMSGVELFTKIHNIDPGLRIIFSSGFHDKSLSDELIKKGVAGFIFKPYSFTDFAEILEKVKR